MALTARDFDKEFGALLERIQKKATAFPNDSTERKRARVKRAIADELFFAATYFPHYMDLPEEYLNVWKNPDAEIDWLKAGFAPFHRDLYKLANTFGQFNIIVGFRESAKSTHLGKIDAVRKLVIDDKNIMRWFITLVARTEQKAEGKVVPIKMELESNVRLRNDFGDLVGAQKWEYGAIKLANGRAMYSYGRLVGIRGEEVDSHRPDHPIFDDISDPTNPDGIEIVDKFVKMVKGNYLKAVNSKRWSGVYLGNWILKGDITDELLTGKHTAHFHKEVYRKLISNELLTKEDREIARQCREAGFDTSFKSAWEYRHPTLKILKEQKDDPETFDTEDMQRPRSAKGQKFKDSFFQYHTKSEIAAGKYIFYSAVDPSADDAGDNKATITVGVGLRKVRDELQLHIPVMKATIEQQSIDDMLDEGYSQKNKYHVKMFGVEMVSGFKLLEREYKRLMKKKGLLPFHKIETKGESKGSRIERLVPYVKNGIITFDATDPGQDVLIQQMKAFPNGGQVSRGGLGDDGPDALEMVTRLIDEFPPFDSYQDYQTVERREMRFEEGAY